MELTSYGSGTHGYLPPECYEGDASRIDTKVDVFSAGVVFYVMLFYPHKPFFRQANQAEIMQMQPHAIRAETQALAFPAKVSADAQALLRRCLNPNRDERPDVLALLDDPYLAPARAARDRDDLARRQDHLPAFPRPRPEVDSNLLLGRSECF